MAICVHVFFLNALKIDCFIIKEGKYPHICYNGFLIPLASDNISFYKTLPRNMYAKTLLVVADPLFKRPICVKVPLCFSLPSLDAKKVDKKLEVLLRASNFRKKNLLLAFSPDKRKHRLSVEFQCYKLFVKGT